MQYRKLSDLKKLEGNPRQISNKDFAILCKSIQDNPKYFEARPLILSDRTGELIIIAGNMRYEAAKKLKIKQVPTFLIEGLDEIKEKEIIIRDNVSNGEFDWDALANAWSDLPLNDWGVDIPADWAADQVEPADAEPQIDKAAELNKKWKVKTGDMFRIGDHRLLCGDSTKREDVERVMGGEMADCLWTDPPYLVNFKGSVYANGKRSFNSGYDEIENDNLDDGDASVFLDSFLKNAFIFLDGAFYITFSCRKIYCLLNAIVDLKQVYRSIIVWDKGNFTLSSMDYKSNYEPMVYGWVGKHTFYGEKGARDIWPIARTSKNDLHPTMKPVALIGQSVLSSTSDSQIVMDLFLGRFHHGRLPEPLPQVPGHRDQPELLRRHPSAYDRCVPGH